MTGAYQAAALARVEDFELLLITADGFGPTDAAPSHGTLGLVVRGSVGIETSEGAGARLETGDLTVVPMGMGFA